MESDCRNVAALISDFVDGSLGPREQALVASHIEGCERCRREVERTREIVARLDSLGGNRAPLYLWPCVARRIDERRTRRSLSSRFRIMPGWRMVLIPAAAAAAVAFFLLGPMHPAGPKLPQSPAAVAQASAELSAYMQAYSQFRSAQPLSDRAAIAAAAHLEREDAPPR